MPATNRKDIRIEEFLTLTMKSIQHARNVPRRAFTLSTFLGLALLVACSFGCAPSSSQGDGKSASANGLPELTEDIIRDRINDAYLRQVPEESGAGEPISWRFDQEEPKEFTVIEKQVEGERATIVLDIKTGSAPGARSPRHLAGQIRTKWELQTGWVLRRWEIVETENVSMKYKNLPKPPAQNSNR